MSEEIKNPAKNVPRAMVFSLLLNGSLGCGMLLATLFSIGNLDTVLATPTGYPFMAIFADSVGSIPAALTMAALPTMLNIAATIGFVTTASRMTWSFARDNGTPGWQVLSKVCLRLQYVPTAESFSNSPRSILGAAFHLHPSLSQPRSRYCSVLSFSVPRLHSTTSFPYP